VGHAALRVGVEAVDVMNSAEPVLARLAVAALPAGNDLFRDGAVAESQAVLLPGLLAEGHDRADQFMPGGDGSLHVALAVLIAPEQRRPDETLHVGGADAAGVQFDYDFAGAGRRRGYLFEAVVFRSVAADSAHGLRQPIEREGGHRRISFQTNGERT